MTLAAKSTADRANLTPSSERLVNCYAYPAPEGAKAPLVIRAVPGLRDWCTVSPPFLRELTRVENSLYALANGGLYRISETGAASFLVAIPDDPNATMCGHRDKITITANGVYFVWDGTLSAPSGNAFSEFGSVIFLDQFTLFSERGGRRVGWSTVGDPETLNGLYFATAEARDDKIIRLVEFGGYFSVLKEHSVELWGSTGLGGSSAFRRIDGAVLDRGIKSFRLVAKSPDMVVFVGEDDTVYQTTGAAPSPISPPNVNQALRDGEPTHCFYYEDRGHRFFVIRFHDRPSWVYDASMGYWHERAIGTDHKPWGAVSSALCYGQWHIGDRMGRVQRLGALPYDTTQPMRRMIRSRNLYVDGKRFTVPEIQVVGLFGNYDVEEVAPNWETDQNGFPIYDQDGFWLEAQEQGPVTTTRRPGRIEGRFSKDGGHTFGLPKVRNIGRVGQYRAEAKWHALGQFQDMVAELSLTDPVDVPLLSDAYVVVS